MNNTDSTILLLVGGIVLLLGLLFLLPPAEPAVLTEPSPAASVMPPTTNLPETSSASASTPVPAPVVSAGLDRVVHQRETLRLAGEGHDPSGLPLTFAWSVQGAPAVFENAGSPTTAFTAPSSCGCETRVILTLTATNAHGVSASDQMVLTVRNPLACPPKKDMTNIVCLPVDPCAQDREVATCPATPDIACDSPCISEAPSVPACPPAVPCPCAEAVDCIGVWDTAWPIDTIPAHPKDRAKPSIDRHYPAQIDEESSVQLRGTVRNPACQPVCFVWSASKGHLENADTLSPTYHAPASHRREGETVTIMLLLYDNAGGRSFDQIRIKIRNTDAP
jgi:hypothetical protein